MPVEVLPEPFPENGVKEFYKGFFDWAPLEIEDAAVACLEAHPWNLAFVLCRLDLQGRCRS